MAQVYLAERSFANLLFYFVSVLNMVFGLTQVLLLIVVESEIVCVTAAYLNSFLTDIEVVHSLKF